VDEEETRLKPVSILNHVLGPVMRGPSSSHTAGAFHIARMARGLLGGIPRRAILAFDPAGSYARTYAPQGADRAFAMGFLDRPLTDPSFFAALDDAARAGLDLCFEIRPLKNPVHPNSMEIELEAEGGRTLRLEARSIGGGDVEIASIDGWPVLFDGTAFEVLVESDGGSAGAVLSLLKASGVLLDEPAVQASGGRAAVVARRRSPLGQDARSSLAALRGQVTVRESPPVFFIQSGRALFADAAGMAGYADAHGVSLGRAALAYEAALLDLSPDAVLAEILNRYDIMAASVESGLRPDFEGLQLLRPSAGAVFRAEAEGRLATKSLHTRAAARAMAVMHVDAAMGVVCAAPTGGSAGVLPGTLVTLAEERNLAREEIALAFLAAGAIGIITAARATFAAEVAGCQVEIGAAGAMAAAAVVEAAGGTPLQACDAAAIAFQNSMGSVCDLVQGMVEIPCHTRNAAAAASAFVCADLVLGGYVNPVPLDETIDAVLAVGKMLPSELRCTSRGGLALAPSALAIEPRSRKRERL